MLYYIFSGSSLDVPGAGHGEILIWNYASNTGITCWDEN